MKNQNTRAPVDAHQGGPVGGLFLAQFESGGADHKVVDLLPFGWHFRGSIVVEIASVWGGEGRSISKEEKVIGKMDKKIKN